jgi:hypothetical protein
MDKIFTPREVDTLLPKLESIFHHMDSCRTRVLELNKERPAGGDQQTVAEVADTARIRSQMEFLLQAVRDDVTLVEQVGGVVKDVEGGLVDFLGRVGGQEVWLCWKRGEKKIRFWHPLYAGFSERQTLKRNEDRTSTTH